MNEFFTETFLPIWQSGGVLMYPLALLAFLIYFTGVELMIYLSRQSGGSLDSETLSAWVDSPDRAKGEVGEMIRYVKDSSDSQSDVLLKFGEIRNDQLGRVDRRKLVLAVLVSAAPLTGLLGTVMGMLDTFRGLAVSTGGQTVNLVAGGISQALITTQLGLIIAIPGYLILSSIEKRRNRVDTVITSLECLLMQNFQNEKVKETVLNEEKALV